MPLASGLFKQVAYKVETTYGVAPTQAAAQLLRRTQSTIDLSKDTYQSNELRPDFQVADFRHGVRRIQGSVAGEVSPRTYADFFAAACKRDFSPLAAATAVSLTIGAPVSGIFPLTRAAGSWLTDGFKVGQVIRLTVGALNANNISKNLLITDITSATVAQVIPLNGTTLTPEGPVTGCTVTMVGRQTFVPTTGHTDRSFTFEHWFSDVPASELFLGCKIDKIAVDLPPTGIATLTMDVMGQDLADTPAKRGAVALSSQYFTSPTAVTTTGTLASVNGIVRLGGTTLAILTSLKFEIDPSFSGDPVVGANTIPNQFAGKVMVQGEFTAYFDNTAQRDAFVNESEIDLIAVFTADNTAASDFISFTFPRIKVGGASKNDGDGGIVQTLPFQALLNSAGGVGVKSERTTFQIQDSQA